MFQQGTYRRALSPKVACIRLLNEHLDGFQCLVRCNLEALAIIDGLSVNLHSVLRPPERVKTMPVAYQASQYLWERQEKGEASILRRNENDAAESNLSSTEACQMQIPGFPHSYVPPMEVSQSKFGSPLPCCILISHVNLDSVLPLLFPDIHTFRFDFIVFQ